MDKLYNRINWQNLPSRMTTLGATNLNRVDMALDKLDDRVIEMDVGKLSISVANTMVKSFNLDETTGVITVILLDGTVYTWDLNIEKIPVKLSMTADAVLILETADGGQYQADLKKLIDTYIFDDSDTIGFATESKADGKHVTAIVKDGSIQGRHLEPDYLSNIKTEVSKAEGQAELSAEYADIAKRWAVGGVVSEDVTDNSKYYAEQAKTAAARAEETVTLNLPLFFVDIDTGHLIGTYGEQFNFYLDANGHLISEVMV